MLRCLGAGAVDDLPAHGEIASVGERGIEPGEQPVDRLRLDQPLAEQPHRRRVRHRAVETKSQEPLERQPILDLELSGLVGEQV